MSAETQVMSISLEGLEQRAGASDADRPAWLAERRGGITATEVRDLYLKKVTQEKLIARKLGRIPEVDDLSYVPIIRWGKQREPEIAAEALARYGMRPESRVFRAADNPRFLASPDGVGVNFDEVLQIAEIKTHGADQDVAPGGAEYKKKGYLAQKVWGMRVTGARRCLYVTEERLPDGTWFKPGEQHFYWLRVEDEGVAELAAELEVIAVDFLAALDAAAAEPWDGPAVDEEIDTFAVNVLTGRVYEAQAKELKDPAWSGLLALLAGRPAFSQESLLARVTWSPGEPGEQTVPDVEAAKAADPGLFAEVQSLSQRWNEHAAKFNETVPVEGKPRLTVTAVKQKETKS